MKFLIDAQLPKRAVEWFVVAGTEAIHTLDLAEGNRTTDVQIIAIADQHQRTVVTKDSDFVDSFTLHRRPGKLLLISVGNMRNAELAKLITPLIPSIVHEMEIHSFIELGSSGLIIRG